MKSKEKKTTEPIIPAPPLFIPSSFQMTAPWLPSSTDPQGSWTGNPDDRDEVPVQDVDDL